MVAALSQPVIFWSDLICGFRMKFSWDHWRTSMLRSFHTRVVFPPELCVSESFFLLREIVSVPHPSWEMIKSQRSTRSPARFFCLSELDLHIWAVLFTFTKSHFTCMFQSHSPPKRLFKHHTRISDKHDSTWVRDVFNVSLGCLFFDFIPLSSLMVRSVYLWFGLFLVFFL